MAKQRGRVFEQVFLKPGRYAIGGGRFADLTAGQIREHVENTRRLIKAGYAPPVLTAHAKPGAKSGAPRPLSAADKVRNGVGWLEDVRVDGTGAAIHRLRITDAQAAQKIAEGSVRFASPELRPAWEDGLGNHWQNVISHMALTHKPRNPNQSEFREVDHGSAVAVDAGPAQYSLDAFSPLQFGDDEDDDDEDDEDDDFQEFGGGEGGGEPDEDAAAAEMGNGSEPSGLVEAEEEDESPDMPEPGSEAKRRERMMAIIAHLDKRGVGLPEDTAEADIDTLLDRLLTALLTANKFDDMEAESAASQEAEEAERNKPPQVVEQRGIGQYSLDNLAKAPPLLRKVIRYRRKELEDQLARMVSTSQIAPAARDAFLGHSGARQFSADGEFRAVLSLPQVVALLAKTIPPGVAMQSSDLDKQFGVEDHPDGEKHSRRGTLLTPEEAKAAVDGQRALAGMFRK